MLDIIKDIIKYTAIALAAILGLVIIFILGCAFFPDIFYPAVARIQDMFSSIPPINIQDSQFINFNMDFELPKFEFNFNGDIGSGAESATPSFHFSGWIIATVVIAIVVASIHPIISTIVTIGFSVLGGHLAVQSVAVYKELVATGSTTWKAAGSCFWPLFVIFIIVWVSGIASLVQTFFDDSIIVRILGTSIVSIIIAAILSLIATLIVLLILGLGWVGGIYLLLGVSIAFSAILALVGISNI